MGKRQRQKTTMSHRIKTRHKKSTINRKIANTKVDKNLKHINQIISKQMDKAAKQVKQNPQNQTNPKIQLQSISADELRKMLAGEKTRQKPKAPRINLDQSLVLEKLIKKWGTDFGSMKKDIKLNRLQWTEKQIEKKYEAYQKMVEQQQNGNNQ